MNPLDLFIGRVARELRSMPGVKRDEELRELRSHLEQRVEDFEAQGLNLEDAQRRATEGFGSARALGSQLCDVWEGIPFSWWRVARSVLRATVILFVGLSFTTLALALLRTQPVTGLMPELFPLLVALYLSLPFVCGMLFSCWLGRRGRLIGLIYIAFMFSDIKLNASSGFAPPDSFVAFVNSLWSFLFSILSGFTGAVFLHVLQTRPYRIAIAGGSTKGVPPLRTWRLLLNFKVWSLCLGLCLLLPLLEYERFRLVMHPTDALSTLRNSLVLDGGPQGFESARITSLEQLHPRTPAEVAGRERRVEFQIEARANRFFAADQIKYLQRQIAANRIGPNKSTQAALARVRRNHQIIEGTVRLTKTPNGWKVDEKSFDRSKLWSWFYDRG